MVRMGGRWARPTGQAIRFWPDKIRLARLWELGCNHAVPKIINTMKNKFLQMTVLGMAIIAVAATPLTASAQADKAAEKPEKAAKAKKEGEEKKAANPNRAIPFNGKLASKSESSITVGERTFQVNAETKIMKNGKEATLADGVVGEPVGGSYRNVDGALVAKMIRFGAKPEAEAKEKTEKPEKAEKAAKSTKKE
jgi:hypothetical protein